ncbi:MAG: HigA family addiction module antidote protein [Caldilineaceae bacterium]|nr:HigA family addiction module antidote protein [Caldilineaceae bacterium]
MNSQIKNSYMPDMVSYPGETVLETIESYGMSQAELAERMGRPKKTVNEIINGKAAITPETALQLERVLGVPARFWMNREQQYREALARSTERTRLEGSTDWLARMPVAEMVKRGWIRKMSDSIAQIEELLNFFGVASPKQWNEVWLNPQVAFRKSLAYSSTPEALAAWLRKGELEAQHLYCHPFDAQHFQAALIEIRKLTVASPAVFVDRATELCAASGVALVLVPQLKQTKVSGATRWITAEKALLQLSLRDKEDGQFWFSFFHEAGHILRHGKKDVFIEDENTADPERSEQKEREANQFAANLLIDPTAYQKFVSTRKTFSKADIRQFATDQNIAPGIVVGRLQHDKVLPFSHCNELKVKFVWANLLTIG